MKIAPSKWFSRRTLGKTLAVAALCGVACGLTTRAQAQALTVGNFSFETPNDTATSPYYTTFPAQTNPNTPLTWEGYATFSAAVVAGRYGVVPAGLVGAQFGDESGGFGGGVIQELSDYNATPSNPGGLFVANTTYTFTLAVGLRSDSVPGAGRALDIRFYYRTADGAAANQLAATTITVGNAATPLSTTALTDYSVTFTALAGQAEIGKPIGLWIPTSASPGTNSGDFIFDNARLTATAAVPEPSTWAMMLGGLGLLVGARRLRRARLA